MQDWRLHPAWGPVGVFLSILSLFPPTSPAIKTLVIIVVLTASAYAFFGKSLFRRKPVASRYGDFSSSITQDARGSLYPVEGEEEHTKLELRLLGRVLGSLIVTVIVGPPAILLTLTSITWLHVIGIILLVFLGIAGVFMFSLPEVELLLWKSGKKLKKFHDDVGEVSTALHEMAEEMRRRGQQ